MELVYVTQGRPGHDYSKAEKFGRVVICTEKEWPTIFSGQDFSDMRAEVFLAMEDYRPGVDFILTAGSPVTILFVGFHMGEGLHKILKWNNATKDYEMCILPA